MSGLLPTETVAKPPFSELVEIAYVLDEAMDRLPNEMPRQLIRRSLRPDCSAEDRARIVEALQDVIDKGLLPNATRVLNEELGPPDPIPLFSGRACATH